MRVEDGQFNMKASGQNAVDRMSEFLAEREKTRRWLLLSTVVLTIFSGALLVFAPEGKETISYVVAGVLFIFALGSIGATVFTFRLPGASVSTGGQQAGSNNNNAIQQQE